jgi:hypothetical protein
MDPTVHGYSLTARKPAAGVGATWGFAGTPPSRVASTLAYVSAASDLSEAPLLDIQSRSARIVDKVMAGTIRHRQSKTILVRSCDALSLSFSRRVLDV